MKRKLQLVFLLLTLLVIWGHSLMPGGASTAESDTVLNLAQGLFGSGITVTLVRKGAHFTEYAAFGLQLFLILDLQGPSRAVRALELGALAAFLDETIQLIYPDRNGQIPDVWLDIVGVLFGICVAALILICIKRRSSPNSSGG